MRLVCLSTHMRGIKRCWLLQTRWQGSATGTSSDSLTYSHSSDIFGATYPSGTVYGFGTSVGMPRPAEGLGSDGPSAIHFDQVRSCCKQLFDSPVDVPNTSSTYRNWPNGDRTILACLKWHCTCG